MHRKEKVFSRQVGETKIVPITVKILSLFAVFLLTSNLASNYINLIMNRGVLLQQESRLIVKDLKELYSTAANQYSIFEFSKNLPEALKTIEEAAAKNLSDNNSIAFAVRPDATILFWSSQIQKPASFSDSSALAFLTDSRKSGHEEGKLNFFLNGKEYYSVYKYNASWDSFLIRATGINEFYAPSRTIFIKVSLIIIGITIVCLVIGIILIRYILRFVSQFTHDIMSMQQNQKLSIIDLSGAPNDDISYLGASFNSLSATINNLLNIFKRFVTQDVAHKAYSEHIVKLEGNTRELTILFSDIKGFTFMTETLGNDIIDVLNLHYGQAIRHIHANEGIVGSIIGDALLAVFGTMESSRNKSVEALNAAVKIQEVTAQLRSAILKKTDDLILRHGSLSEAEKSVLKATLVEVGVGIDGGEVFYGNIGSYERMANTVIGDNVNSASRLEGLTRLYKVPIICSEFIKDNAKASDYYFAELDQVQVKGKLEGKRIYWPIPKSELSNELELKLKLFNEGLLAYYDGDWEKASSLWDGIDLPMIDEFKKRLENEKPQDWTGIWAMTTK